MISVALPRKYSVPFKRTTPRLNICAAQVIKCKCRVCLLSRAAPLIPSHIFQRRKIRCTVFPDEELGFLRDLSVLKICRIPNSNYKPFGYIETTKKTERENKKKRQEAVVLRL